MTSPTSVETYVTKWAKEKLQDGMYAVSRYFGKSTVKNGKNYVTSIHTTVHELGIIASGSYCASKTINLIRFSRQSGKSDRHHSFFNNGGQRAAHV